MLPLSDYSELAVLSRSPVRSAYLSFRFAENFVEHFSAKHPKEKLATEEEAKAFAL